MRSKSIPLKDLNHEAVEIKFLKTVIEQIKSWGGTSEATQFINTRAVATLAFIEGREGEAFDKPFQNFIKAATKELSPKTEPSFFGFGRSEATATFHRTLLKLIQNQSTYPMHTSFSA